MKDSMSGMKYCSECGSLLEWKDIESRRRRYCSRCERIVYRLLKVGAGCIIEKDGSILLVKRRKAPFQGCWNLPAGYVEYDEAPEEAAVRETKEETGLDVEIIGLAGVYFFADDPRGNGILVAYRCGVVRGEVTETDESEKIEYFGKERLPGNLAGGGHDQAIQEWAAS